MHTISVGFEVGQNASFPCLWIMLTSCSNLLKDSAIVVLQNHASAAIRVCERTWAGNLACTRCLTIPGCVLSISGKLIEMLKWHLCVSYVNQGKDAQSICGSSKTDGAGERGRSSGDLEHEVNSGNMRYTPVSVSIGGTPCEISRSM